MLKAAFKKFFVFLPAILLVAAFGFTNTSAQDLSVEEIIARHLDSIGSKELRAQIKNSMVLGASEFVVKVPYTSAAGKALLASEAGNLLFLSSFNSIDYPLERIGFFKNKINIPYIKPGVRSPLGNFLLINDKIVSSGLLAGSILPSWAFLDQSNSKARIETAGKKKINGRETFVLSFMPKSGFSADTSIKIYFDAENFHHLRTEYRQKITNKSYSIGIFAGDKIAGDNLLAEDFGDFRTESNLTLPHSYKVTLNLDSGAGTNEYEWNIAIKEYFFNQKFDPSLFSFDKKTSGFDKNSY